MKNTRLLLPLAAASATAGIAAASFFSALLIFVLSLFFVYIKTKQLSLVFVSLSAFTIYFFLTSVIDSHNVSSYDIGTYKLRAVIHEIPKIDGDRMSMVVRTPDGEKWASSYKMESLAEKEKLSQIEPGTSCTFTGSLEKPKNATVPGTFDYKQYLYSQHIHWNYSITAIQNCSTADGIQYWLLSVRKSLISFVNDHVPESSAGIVQALILGDRFYLMDDVLEAYQKLGVVHLLAISGLHVGIVTAGIFYVLIRIGVTREKAAILLLLFLPVYTILTGAAPSVMRAALMSGLYFIGSLWGKRMNPSIVICLSYLILLLFNPYHLFQIGFQLSFAVSFSLILSSSIFKKLQSGGLVQLAMVSLIAQLGSLPILIYYFQQFSLISIPMNIIMVPFYTMFVMPFSMIGFLLLSLSEPVGEYLFYWFDYIMCWSDKLIKYAADIEQFTVIAARPNALVLFGLIGSIVVLLTAMEKSPLYQRLLSVLLFIAMLFLVVIFPRLDPEGEVDMLDIGQGDSMFISAPYQRGHVMIDTGGILSYLTEPWREKRHPFSLSEKVLIPFLTAKGIKQLDALILTHADQDHIGEAKVLIERHKVKQLIVPKGFVSEPNDEKVLRTAQQEGIRITEVKRGDTFQIKDLQFLVLSPETPDLNSKNNSSLVLWMKTGHLSWVLTGDLEKEGEQEIMKAFPDLKADILKAGHHGSKGSTGEEFVRQLKPKAAIISAGENNRYHHPHQEVLDILTAHSVRIFRTDQSGTIQYRFKSGFGTFSVYPPYDTTGMTETN
ncbi:DNA internalization-related competence protein ComEC/Rec2 [Bacillus atrophaeus]|uniref:DNA internalization-related competence protein ComEC/Rec2 n=1 Tax=Bacillus atrophaeus TaxID=1452 RepID=UPI0022803670|nr:DNA internalization-related competence protein ComEC/Rec2 [Bacillus atrophaeus]MCY8959560.1 DNA internalization-related competence protein ComEC/Rec2 [Bacillus atrophaeus]MCY8963267.1 DNA internalization-related competence protein ComEC/Rec2 [Bacillus atrophaeus]MCY9437649.1 DNA internalization-related competence protein ComEC/Rec2 [Bacillus atrophaeus]MEC0648994.1 DNA internalization-related competence protein ComEC/Rec2 [Bacillus atrophaeus]